MLNLIKQQKPTTFTAISTHNYHKNLTFLTKETLPAANIFFMNFFPLNFPPSHHFCIMKATRKKSTTMTAIMRLSAGKNEDLQSTMSFKQQTHKKKLNNCCDEDKK